MSQLVVRVKSLSLSMQDDGLVVKWLRAGETQPILFGVFEYRTSPYDSWRSFSSFDVNIQELDNLKYEDAWAGSSPGCPTRMLVRSRFRVLCNGPMTPSITPDGVRWDEDGPPTFNQNKVEISRSNGYYTVKLRPVVDVVQNGLLVSFTTQETTFARV